MIIEREYMANLGKMNKLFLVFDSKLYFYDFCSTETCHCKQVFRHNKILFKIAHILKKVLGFVPPFFWDGWKKQISNYDVIVITDYIYFPYLFKYIKKHNKNAKVFFYYMNEIDTIKQKYLRIEELQKYFKDGIYTYNNTDALENIIFYKPTMYAKYNNLNYTLQTKNRDFIFLGRDKGRSKSIISFYEQLKDIYTFNIRILGGKGIFSTKKFISYKDYLQDMIECETIIEITSHSSQSVSLRIMEALFYNKKIITNNIGIIQLPIYEEIKKNVLFVDFEHPNMDQIKLFQQKKIEKIDEKIIYKYEFSEWMKSFTGKAE